jgi:CheY-like chemotaxis protein
LASNAQFDLIILDYIIRGGQGGLETLKQIREKDNNVPVVVTSGYSNNPVLARFAEYGFSGRLPKPFDSQEVIALLDDFLGNANDASPQK